MRNKKAVSELIVIVTLILLVLATMIIVYSIVIPLIKEKGGKIENSQVLNSLELNSIIYNTTTMLTNIQIHRTSDNNNISYIKVIVLGESSIKNYNIFNVPEILETKIYTLNTTDLGKIKEITVYPFYYNGKSVGIGERKLADINEQNVILTINFINPSLEKSDCNSNFKCSGYSKCTLYYDLNNLINNEISLRTEQTRVCDDSNKCNFPIFERKMCDDKASVIIRKVIDNGKTYVEVYDINNNLVSRLEYIKGTNDQLNIELDL